MSFHKRQSKRQQQRPNNYFHVALAVLFTSVILFTLQQRMSPRLTSSNVSVVKRENPVPTRYSESDLARLELLRDAQPDNQDIPKAIRTLKVILFQQWLRNEENNAMRLDTTSVDHKGVYASKKLSAGKVVVRIPIDRILTVEMVMKTEIGKRLRPLDGSLHIILGTYIALQRYNTSCEIYPYLRILPERMDFMPILAEQAALESLNGTSAWNLIVQRKVEIDDEWMRVAPAFPELKFDDFIWGVLISMTRAAGVNINGTKTAGLVPLLNDFRHAPAGHSTTSTKTVDGYYVVVTSKEVEAATELTRNYGSRSAQIFYCDYGDVPSVLTAADSIGIEFYPAKSYPTPEVEDVVGAWRRKFLLTADLSSPQMKQLLSYLRMRVATDSEWKKAQELTEDLSHISFIDEANEKRAVAELHAAIVKNIQSLDCTGPSELPANASSSFLYSVEQARDVCAIEKQLAELILEKLPELESEPKSLPVRTDWNRSGDAFEDAMHWVVSGGAQMDAVEIVRYGDSFRGITAKQRIERRKHVMVVPLSHCITSISARRTALAQEAMRNNVSLTAHAMMAAMIIEESRKPDSHFRPFLDTLPASFDNFMIYYTPEELDLLKGTRALAEFRSDANEIAEDFEIVRQAAPIASASITFDEYRRARHAVDSRNFIFEAHGKKSEHILVPYVDMMNHDLVPNTQWRFDPDTATFVVDASKTIDGGETLVTSYGEKPNAQLLIGYGFALPNNPFDKATLRLDENTMCVVQKTFNTIDNADCFLKLRKKFASEVELLQKMNEGATKGLARFKITIEEDQALADALLKEPDTGNDRVRFCVLTRLGEKLVLKFWIETTEKLLQYYAGNIQRDELDPILFEQYFKVLEQPELFGSKVRGKTKAENAEN